MRCSSLIQKRHRIIAAPLRPNTRSTKPKPVMKRLTALVTTLALGFALTQSAQAGDREWATAGKILTGVFAGSVLTRALEPAPVYTYQSTTTYYTAPAVVSTPVYVQQPQVIVQPAPVVVQQPAQVVVQTTPVYVQPAPVMVQTWPVYVRPSPVVTYHHSHHHGFFGRPRAAFCW